MMLGRRSLRPILGAVSAVALLSLVGPSCGFDCSAVGCIDGLSVMVAGAPPFTELTIEALEGDSVVRSVRCSSAGGPCIATFSQYHPTTVTIRVSWDADTVTTTTSPTYETVQPNGPACGPTCRTATVTLNVPEG